MNEVIIVWEVVRAGVSTRCVLSTHAEGFQLRMDRDGQAVARTLVADETRALAVAQEWRRRHERDEEERLVD